MLRFYDLEAEDIVLSLEEERARAEQAAWRRKSASPNSRRNCAVCAGSRVSRAFRNPSQTLRALAHVAGYTERVRLATNSVNLPHRNAVTTPEQLVTQDVLP